MYILAFTRKTPRFLRTGGLIPCEWLSVNSSSADPPTNPQVLAPLPIGTWDGEQQEYRIAPACTRFSLFVELNSIWKELAQCTNTGERPRVTWNHRQSRHHSKNDNNDDGDGDDDGGNNNNDYRHYSVKAFIYIDVLCSIFCITMCSFVFAAVVRPASKSGASRSLFKLSSARRDLI